MHPRRGAVPQRRPSASADTPTRTLADLPAGAAGVVHTLRGGRGLTSRLLDLGLTPGVEVTVVQNRGRGALIVLVRDVRVALGRGQARMVEIVSR